jgi:putative hemolysin
MSLKLGDDVEFQTVAGLVLEELKHLPELGESFVRDGWRFEVIDLDGRRVDKILVSAVDANGEAVAAG